MEENSSSQEEVVEELLCRSCSSPNIESGHSFPLCSKCRTVLSKRPVPLWIKLSLVFVAIITVIAFGRFPQVIKTGIEFERGIRAERENKHATALKYYQRVVETYPYSSEALARLYIAYFNNEKIDEALKTLDLLLETDEPHENVVKEVNNVTDRINVIYYPDEAFIQAYEANLDKDLEKQEEVLKEYYDKNPGGIFEAYFYSSVLFDLARYDEAERIMQELMESNSDFNPGYLLLASIYRDTGEYEKGIECCNKVFKNNIEYAPAYAAKSRLELKRYNDKIGLELALRAYELDKSQPYTISSLALAYHYNNLIEDRDRMFEQFKKQSPQDEYTIQLLSDIFSEKMNWRE